MIERAFLWCCLLGLFIVACIVGFFVIALAPHIREIGDLFFDLFRVFYIFLMLGAGIGLLELWALMKHHREMLEIKREKMWLDSRIGGLPGELIYAGEDSIQHISAIKEAAPMMSYGDMLHGQIDDKKNAIVTAYDEGIAPHQIAQHHKKGVGYIYDVLIKSGRRP